MFRNSLSLSSSYWKSTIYNKNQCIHEYVDKRLLCSIIENGDNVIYTDKWAENFPDLKTQLTKYLNLYKQDTIVETHLYQPLHKWGRMNVEGQLSLSVLHRATRHTLAEGFYKDVDMVNAEPKAFYEMLKQHGLPDTLLEILKDYCDNRKQRIAEIIQYYKLPDLMVGKKIIMTKEERVKKWFLALFNGGDLNTIITQNDLNNLQLETNPYLLNFWNKYDAIIDVIAEPNRHIYDDYCESKCEDTSTYTETEIKRKIVAFVYQTLERKIQETAINHLVESKGLALDEIIPSQDGFMVRRGLWRDEFIVDIENAVNSKFGFTIPFKVKDFDEKFNIDLLDADQFEDFINNITTHEYYANNDTEASELVFEKIKKNLRSCDGRLYYKSGNVWIYGNRVEDHIKNVIKSMDIHKRKTVKGKDGVEHYIISDFAQKYSVIESIYKTLVIGLLKRVADPLFYNKLHTSNKGKFAFIDGVLDYATNKFYNWNAPELKEYYTTIIINRPFRAYFENPDRDLMKKINTEIFESLVGKDDVQLFLQFLSRAVSGFCLDKNLANYMGNRDSGKGVIYELLTAFEAYVGSFDITNLLCSRQSKDGKEPERERAWLVCLEFIRLAISQETEEADADTGKMVESKKINNKAIKSFQSGFDNITAREAYGKVINFKIDATALILGNYDVEFSGSKDGEQHLIKFSGANTYITAEEYDIKLAEKGSVYMGTYRKRDDGLYAKINENYDYKNAVIMLLLENFVDKPCSQIREKEIDMDGKVVSVNARDRIFDFYEITGDENDKVSKDEFHRLVGGDKKKVVCELKSMNCVGDKNCRLTIKEENVNEDGTTTEKNRQVVAYKGLKLKPDEL